MNKKYIENIDLKRIFSNRPGKNPKLPKPNDRDMAVPGETKELYASGPQVQRSDVGLTCCFWTIIKSCTMGKLFVYEIWPKKTLNGNFL